uniref:Uncharacterized protein n=1 Tax=Trichogramma kaykai TaxID=54128 RepID=A0ABD2W1C7_9HYME
MEVVEPQVQNRKCCQSAAVRQPSCDQENRPAKKCTRKYVQPARAKPFAPKQNIRPAKNPFESHTTYLESYFKAQGISRAQPFLPVHNITLVNDKFTDNTTSKLSYKPVTGIFKPKPVRPRQRFDHFPRVLDSLATFLCTYLA